MKKYLGTVLAPLVGVMLMGGVAGAHCELPCGIYDDQARLAEISEHVTTIDKAVTQILELQKEKEINYNQLVRWIDNKEVHATKLQEIVSQYFLTQRIKLDADQYARKVEALHHLLVYAMQCKQTVSPQAVEELRQACRLFEKLYLGEQE